MSEKIRLNKAHGPIPDGELMWLHLDDGMILLGTYFSEYEDSDDEYDTPWAWVEVPAYRTRNGGEWSWSDAGPLSDITYASVVAYTPVEGVVDQQR